MIKREMDNYEARCERDVLNILIYFARLNYILTKHKAKPVYGSGKKKAKVGYDKSGRGEQKRKITRIIDGTVRIDSVKPPHAFEGERTIKYKIAKWNRRGYVRTYKSGKKVYVKPAVCHRKALSEIDDKQEVRKADVIFAKKEVV